MTTLRIVRPELDDELEDMIREIEKEMEGLKTAALVTDDRLRKHHVLARRRYALLAAQGALQSSKDG